MLLTIDVGNTNTVFGIYKDDKLHGSFRISTRREYTSDELGMEIYQQYTYLGINICETKDVIISSVVPPIMHTLGNAIKKYVKVNPLIVGENIDAGMVNLYENPKEVGVDRLVNAVYAVEKYGSPLIIIDIGTATTFDAVNARGEYMGGAIFPGMVLSMEALFMKAAKLPRVDISRPEKAIGRNTVQSMQSGAVRGYVGAVEGIVAEMRKEIEGDVKVIATGGMGRMMSEFTDIIDDVDVNLTLEGLKVIYNKNKGTNLCTNKK